MGCSKSSSKREINSSTIVPQETRKKNQIDNLTLHLKQTGKTNKQTNKKKQKKPKIIRRK